MRSSSSKTFRALRAPVMCLDQASCSQPASICAPRATAALTALCAPKSAGKCFAEAVPEKNRALRAPQERRLRRGERWVPRAAAARADVRVLGSLGAGDALRAVPEEVFQSTPPRPCRAGERVKSSVPVCACAPLTRRYRPPTARPREALSVAENRVKNGQTGPKFGKIFASGGAPQAGGAWFVFNPFPATEIGALAPDWYISLYEPLGKGMASL